MQNSPAKSDASATNAPKLDDLDTVWLEEPSDEAPSVGAIDQTLLPAELAIESLTCKEDVWRAIKRLEVRGAPAIGVCAAFGAYVDAWRLAHGSDARATNEIAPFLRAFEDDCDYLAGCRPTAVNLSWALRRMRTAAIAAAEKPDASVADVVRALRHEATAIRDEDVRACRAIGEHGARLLRKLRDARDGGATAAGGDCPSEQGIIEGSTGVLGILTHCNAGRLATVRYGTATAPLYIGREQGIRFKVFCDETRPLLQGARLTAYELQAAGFDTTVLCDNMSASLMASGAVDAVLVGCDRVAANGDVANKIGTSMVALAAARYGVPFYVCAPTSTIDLATPTGDDIVIERRDSNEVTDLWYARRMAPEGVGVYNPAFDVTPHDLITAIITEHGVWRPGVGN